MKPDVETERGKEKEIDRERKRKREREVCMVFYESDLHRGLRELDTVRLWRKTVSAAVCVCVYMFKYANRSFEFFMVLKNLTKVVPV